MSHIGLQQRLTNTLVVSSAGGFLMQASDLSSVLLSASYGLGTQVSGSLVTVPSTAALIAAFQRLQATSAYSALAASATLTDLGKDLLVEVVGSTDGAAAVRLREVKYQTATNTFVTGYVVLENNYQLATTTTNLLVSRVARC